MEIGDRNQEWILADGTHFLYSVLSLVIVPVLLLVGALWYVVIGIPGAVLEWLITLIFGEGTVHTVVMVFMLLVIVVGFMSVFGLVATRVISGNPTPVTMPTGAIGYIWWGGLPVIVGGLLLGGLASGIEIESTGQFFVLLPLCVFAAILIATRTLSIVRKLKSSDEPSFTITTILVGYVVVAGTLESVALFLLVPLVTDPGTITQWTGLLSVYLPLLVIGMVVFFPLEKLGLVDPSGNQLLSVLESATLEELPSQLPLFFDLETGDGLFTALVIAFLFVPAISAVTELIWNGFRIASGTADRQLLPSVGLSLPSIGPSLPSVQRSLPSVSTYLSGNRQHETAERTETQQDESDPLGNKTKAQREFESARDEYNTALDDAEDALEDGRYDDADKLLNDVATARLQDCQRLHDRYTISASIPDDDRLEWLRSQVQRHNNKQKIEDLVQQQAELIDEYQQYYAANEYTDAEQSLRRVKRLADKCERRASEYSIDYSLPMSIDEIDEAIAELEGRQREQRLEELIQQQADVVDEYRRHLAANEYADAKQSLRQAKRLVDECASMADDSIDYSLPMSIGEIETAIDELETKQREQHLDELVAVYETHLSQFDDAIRNGNLERCDSLFDTLLDDRTRIETLEHELGIESDARTGADQTLSVRIRQIVQRTIADEFDVQVDSDEFDCDGSLTWPEAKAHYLLAAGTHAAAADEYQDAITRAETAIAELQQHLDAASETTHRNALRQLVSTAHDRKTEWERQLIVRQINDAVEMDPMSYEEASTLLEQALSRVRETDAFDSEERSIIEQDAREAYVSVRSDGASALIDVGSERLEDGNESTATDRFADAMAILSDLRDTVAEWSETDIESIDDRYADAEREYVDAHSASFEKAITVGINQYESGEYEEALETFREVTDGIKAVREHVENDYDHLQYLREIAEQNAKTTQRASLGIGTGSTSLQTPEREVSLSAHRSRVDSSIGTAEADAANVPGDDVLNTLETSLPNEIDYEQVRKEEVIGTGGNATVHRASLDVNGDTQSIALKEPQLPEDTIDDSTFDRYITEAENWSEVDDHPHIVSVLDYGVNVLPWIAIEYVNGGHLGDRIGKLATDQALWTALAITRAIRHAHRPGITHLDIKPENILFASIDDHWDAPKVADWGLANHLLDHSDTVEGLSLKYAAPEQFDPETYGSTDLETDIYQLGVVFYELFTGTLPYEGKRHEVLQSNPTEMPAPPSEIADVPPELDQIILKALAPEKTDRHKDAILLEQELEVLFESIVDGTNPQMY